MTHPLLRNRQILLAYFGIWLIIACLQFITLYFSAGFPVGYSIADSLISVFIYMFINLGLWFTIRFGIHNLKKTAYIILNNLILIVATGAIWILLVWGALVSMNVQWNEYYLKTIMSYRLIASMMFYVCSVGVYYAISFYDSLQQKQVHEMQLKALVKEAQLNELRAQLHPHFLFNSLNSINSLTISNPAKAGKMIIHLSEFLRYSLSRKGHSMTDYEKEMYHVKQYIEIEKVRFGDRLEFQFNDENAPVEWPLPLMLLQPLIENAVKHGVNNSGEKVHIHLTAFIENGRLVVRIENNFDSDAVQEKGTGTGLNNVKERLNLVYGDSSFMEIRKDNNLFSVTLKIPKTSNK